MSQYIEDEKNQIILSAFFYYHQGVREVGAAFMNLNDRKFFLSEFQDNEHFSNFESLIIQSNPQNSYTRFTLLINYPQLQSEKEKLEDIISMCEIQVIEKSKKDYLDKNFEQDIDKLIEKPLKKYLKENTLSKSLNSLGNIISHCQLLKDPSNQKQFKLDVYSLTQFMKLDYAALNALSIFPKNYDLTNISKEGESGTLVDLLDKCKTQMGSRCLRRWIKQPLQSVNEINRRLNLVEVFFTDFNLRSHLQNEFLRKLPDLDKLYAKFYKVHSKKKHNCTLSDCVRVYKFVQSIKIVFQYLENYIQKKNYFELMNTNFLQPFRENIDNFEKLEEMIEKSIDLSKIYEGEYMISPKFSEKLTEINQRIVQTRKKLDTLKESISDDLGGIDVKIVESNSHVFLLEVKKKEGDAAFRASKKTYKQVSIKNRIIAFTCEKMQNLIIEYSEHRDTYKEEQSEVQQKILQVVSTYYPAMEEAAILISELDVFTNFSHISSNAPIPYVKPNMVPSGFKIF